MTLKTKILGLMLLLTAAPLVALGAWAVVWLVRDKEAYAFELVSQAAGDAARGVERRARDAAHVAEVVASGAAQQALAGGNPGETFPASGLIALALVDGGRVAVELHLASAPAQAIAAAEDAARRAPGDGKPFVVGVPGLAVGPPLLVVARLTGPTRAVGAVLRAEDLLGASPGLYSTWLVDARGHALWHPDPAVALAQKDLSWTVPVRAMAELPAGTVTTRRAEVDGEAAIAASARTQAGPGVVLLMPEETALGALRSLTRRATALMLLVLLLAGTVAAAFAARVGQRLSALGQASEAIARGDFSAPAPPPGPADELGALALAFARMQRDLAQRDQRLREAREALVQSEKLSALGHLAAGISQEIREPLAAIMEQAQRALTELPDNSPAKKPLQQIVGESWHSKEILDNLMRFSRREEAEQAELDVNAVVRDAWQLVSHQMEARKVRLKAVLSESLPRVRGNENQLAQVLVNLLLNAEYAMRPKGGVLSVATSREADQVVIEVRDEGAGISAENMPRLFTPFFTTKPRGEGMGLGLSVSYGLVKQHGGSLKVWSEIGVGTALYVYLPALVPPALPRRGGPAMAS